MSIETYITDYLKCRYQFKLIHGLTSTKNLNKINIKIRNAGLKVDTQFHKSWISNKV